jgi:hypothetical protein
MNQGETFRANLEEPVTITGQILAPKGSDAEVQMVHVKQSGQLRDEDLSFWRYLWDWINRPLNTTLLIVDLLLLALTFIGGFFSYRHLEWTDTVNFLIWSIPLGVFVLFGIGTFLYIPYTMHREVVSSCRAREIGEKLAQLYAEGRRVRETIAEDKNPSNDKVWSRMALEWAQRAAEYGEQNISSEKAHYLRGIGSMQQMMTRGSGRQKTDIIKPLDTRIERLLRLMKDY